MERVPTPPQEYRNSGLPHCKARLPKRFLDVLPPHPPIVPALTIETLQPSQHEPEALAIPDFKTGPNSFGIYRVYKSGKPSFTPDDNFHVSNVSDGPNFIQDPTSTTWASPFGTNFSSHDSPEDSETTPSYSPFKNMSIFRLM